MDWTNWSNRVKSNPKAAFEADLFVAGGGLFFILMGGMISVTGFGSKTNNNSSPDPALGNILAGIGALFVLLGLLMTLTNGFVWIKARLKARNIPKT